jgi:UDP-N-acetylmuramoyl-tripeptide--D-alanyl-D-alanine ligase
MAFQLLFLLLLLPFTFVRWVRWLAIVQQKEYRLDRIVSFLKSAEGRNDALRFLPRKSEFTRTGMKRPVRTARVAIVALLSILLCGGMMLSGWQSGLPFLSLIFIYLTLPIVLFISCIPSAFVAISVVWITLWRAQQKIKKGHPLIIGIGGSYGKTSTKHLLHHMLSQKQSVFVTPKSHNTKYSVAKSICAGLSNQSVAILEYGTYTRGEIEYLTQWFPPNYAVETGFTLQHLELFGSQENSVLAESELVAALSPQSKVFCNGEDLGAIKICEIGRQKNQVEVVYYAGPHSAVQFSEPELNEFGELSFIWQKNKIETKLVGKHYLPNAQAAAVVAQELGMSEQEIISGFKTFRPNSSFILSSQNVAGATVINDGGTSNPKGFEAAIELMKEMSAEKSILISGGIVDLGSESSAVHLALATAAQKVFTTVCYLGNDGKAEFKQVFGEQLLDDEESIRKALVNIDSTTTILIEGKVPQWVERILK